MVQIFVNLKRFDVPKKLGGVCREADSSKWIESIIRKTIEYAKGYGLKVRYTPEDAVRTDFSNLITVCQAAIEAGTDRISIADTVGAMTPMKMYDFIKKLQSIIDVKLNVHCHNDLGLATANALAAYEAGVSLIDVSINGLGERVGIAPLSEVCLALNSIYREKFHFAYLELVPKAVLWKNSIRHAALLK